MSRLYREPHRALQDRFDTRRLADRIESVTVQTRIDDAARAFIESRDMFFLSSVDPDGRPTVSYKGGDPGFVSVVDETTLAFPSYNGNGMFLSLGNVSATGQVGLLFIDFEKPKRLRVQGEASFRADDPLIEVHPEADLIVRVRVSELFINCPRYVHRYQKVEPSRFVPRAEKVTPVADWKRVDALQDVLPEGDRAQVQRAGGVVTVEEYVRAQNEEG